jgi:subtilase family serine protease
MHTLFVSSKYLKGLKTVATIGLLLALAMTAQAQQRRLIGDHVPRAVAHLKAVGDVPAADRLRLVIGLPLRNQTQLDSLLVELNDPASTNYHRWLTSEQFAQQFGPTEADYKKVIDFAAASGFEVTGRSTNRMLVDVEAPTTNIEKALHLTLHFYPHPKENRNFYAPDNDPSVDTNIPILHISGLDNFTLPHRLSPLKPLPFATNSPVTPYYTGSSPGGYFMGNDFRAAYVPGVTNTGAGQFIAVADVGGLYYSNDIYIYQTNAGLSTSIVVTNIVTTFTPYWTTPLTGSGTDDGEEALDICTAMSVAPGATIMNYEGDAHDVFNRIASDNKAKQITLSYGFGIDVSIIQSFQQFLAQGQAMSQASGDGDADLDGGTGLTGNPYATIVGGTTLTTGGAGGAWSAETAWNWGGGGGSGGGISGYGIPNWQQGAGTAGNQGSTVYRNYPDVAMPGDGVFLVSRNGTSIGSVGGTSCASPLWAGFMALVNQQAASLGKPAVGFPNPAIYAIGKGSYSAYTNSFHDITTGNNFNSQNPTRFNAVTGYDLCTGWGTPRGSNTIVALVGVGTNDFAFYSSPDALTIVRGGVGTATITLARMNGFSGIVSFSISGLPTGVTAVLNPVSTTTSNLLTLTVGNGAVAGTNLITITGISGVLTHSVSLSLIVAPPVPGAMLVSLSGFYNRSGIWTDGRTFSGGTDNGGYAYSANLLGTAPSWNGIVFSPGPANALDVVSCAGQTVNLPAGNFTSLQILGSAVQGNQLGQNFTVTYTDNSTTNLSQNFSDWVYPQHYPGETRVITMPYRNNGGGSKDLYTAVNLYVYNFTLDQTKTVKSLTLPANGNVILLAVALANEPVSAPLNSYYNRAGMYSDGVSFTNPATGGADLGGAAYSASLLGGSQIWTNTLFNFGPANATNIISATNQTIILPAGNYSVLRMLASGVQGSQASQPFIIKYADNTTSTFFQNLSDWFSPQNYAGESKALIMGHRNSSNGTADNRTFYLYGYSFKLNSSKLVQSIKLPNNANVLVTSISLVPNWPPTFTANPFAEPDVMAGQNYSANISTNASDLNGDTLTFAKVSGPAWLNVSGGGALSGMPLSADAGPNSFVVSVTDTGSLSNTATLNLSVQPAPTIVSSITNNATNIVLNWTGGIAPFQVQASTNLADPGWLIVGDSISSNMFIIVPSEPVEFYRIMGR